jgi:heme A synthase
VAKSGRNALFASLIGLVGVVVLLQGLWAGIFLEHDGKREQADIWIRIHANGAEVAIVLAIAATVVAFVKRRARKDLWVGGIVLIVLLVLEGWIGGLIRNSGKATLTAVHVPLAMALMGLVAWLSARAAKRT